MRNIRTNRNEQKLVSINLGTQPILIFIFYTERKIVMTALDKKYAVTKNLKSRAVEDS